MNALLTPITVIPMPTAPTQMEASHVLANQVSVAPEHLALVRNDSIILLICFDINSYLISIFQNILNISRCKRMYY